MKRVRNLGKLLARAHGRETLQLHPDDIEALARFDCIKDAYERGCPLEEGDIEFLIALGEAYTLPAREGRLEGCYHNDRQQDLLCAKYLLDVGKEVYRAAMGLERVRDDEDLRRRAVRLLKQHSPETTITADDLHRFETVPSAAVIAYVQEHMPWAEASMQAFARSLAGKKKRARQGAALS